MKYRNILGQTLVTTSIMSSCFLASGLAFCSEPGGAAEAIQQKAYEITGKDTAVLKFDKKSSAISSNNQSELRTMYNAIRGDSRVKEIVIAAYSDLEYPHDAKATLPHKSRELAAARGDQVKKFLSELGANHVRVVNMAKKSSWMQQVVDTKEAQFKHGADEVGHVGDRNDPFYQTLGRHMQSIGGPEKVVVVVRHD
jgi:hypothetical protein